MQLLHRILFILCLVLGIAVLIAVAFATVIGHRRESRAPKAPAEPVPPTPLKLQLMVWTLGTLVFVPLSCLGFAVALDFIPKLYPFPPAQALPGFFFLGAFYWLLGLAVAALNLGLRILIAKFRRWLKTS